MYKVNVSERAEDELNKIIFYIAEKLAAPKAATDFVDEVDACYEHLEQNPFMYEQCRNPKLQQEGYRRAVIKNYIMIYKIYEESKQVVVHSFFYGRQDYTNMI
ncbi:MAG: type II toxin-antitoxin system RelE/ParE family toxin [Oscillospiraceae bacterium]|jgi:plasmid stabilization system protein ParE|nr:type II toxin-antitoxin system RelE/ParE family toxin [Oscillospiraceae bacterium]